MSDQQKYVNKLQGKRVLCIGGSSGIGFSTAEALVENGANVIVSSSNQSRLDNAVSRIQSAYPSRKAQISGFTVNLGDEAKLDSAVKTLFDQTTENGSKKLDHIIFTAADTLADMALKDVSVERIRAAGTLRFIAPLIVGKHAPQYLKPGPESSIILTTGAVSERPIPNWTVIGSYASGLQGMTRGMALDLAPIRVNVVSPGAVDTELWKGMSDDQKGTMFQQIESHLPLGKVATPEEIAESYLYLMRDTNITGSMISTNGGHLLK